MVNIRLMTGLKLEYATLLKINQMHLKQIEVLRTQMEVQVEKIEMTLESSTT